MPIPNSIDDYTASQLYINPITAWIICTEVLGLKPDDVLLVNACGSAIGRIFAQLSKVLGFRLIAVTRNDNYTQDLLKLGASYVINTTESAFCVRPNGFFLTLGLLSGIPVDWRKISLQAKVNTKLFHLRY